MAYVPLYQGKGVDSLLEIDLRNYLLTNDNLKALIGTRIYPGWIPENATMPSVAFLTVSGVRHHNIDVAYPRIQFSVFSSRYLEAKEIASEIRKSLRRHEGMTGSTRIIQGVFENENEMYEKDTLLYHIACDFKIIYWE